MGLYPSAYAFYRVPIMKINRIILSILIIIIPFEIFAGIAGVVHVGFGGNDDGWQNAKEPYFAFEIEISPFRTWYLGFYFESGFETKYLKNINEIKGVTTWNMGIKLNPFHEWTLAPYLMVGFRWNKYATIVDDSKKDISIPFTLGLSFKLARNYFLCFQSRFSLMDNYSKFMSSVGFRFYY